MRAPTAPEPVGKALSDLAVRCEGLLRQRETVLQRLRDHRVSHLWWATRADASRQELSHLLGVSRVDQRKGGSGLDVVAVELPGLGPIGGAAGRLQQRYVVGVD